MKNQHKKILMHLLLISGLISQIPVLIVVAPSPTWHTHEDLISMFTALCDNNPEYATYEAIGESYEGRSILIFKIGNPDGGKVMWDGCLHGWEDAGGEIEYLFAEWLLESDDPKAEEILEGNQVLLVPVVNMDSYERQNRNFEDCNYGVDLNRNFLKGWRWTPPGDYPDTYHGTTAGSEPEVQALRYAFETHRPDFYVNVHDGGGPWISYSGQSNIVNSVLSRINKLSTEFGVSPYSARSNGGGGNGLAVGDAYNFGASAWLLEVEGGSGCYSHTQYSYEDLVNTYFPKCLAILIAMCEACEIEQSPENWRVVPKTIPSSGTINYNS